MLFLIFEQLFFRSVVYFSASTSFVFLEVTFLFKFFTKSVISFIVANFAYFNLSAKFDDVKGKTRNLSKMRPLEFEKK